MTDNIELGFDEDTQITVNGDSETGDGWLTVKVGNTVLYDGAVTDGYDVTVEYDEWDRDER